MFRSFLIAMAAVVLCTPYSEAAKVKVWHHGSPSNYEKAQLKHAVISNEGALRLSHQLKPLAGLDAMHVWNIVEDKAGGRWLKYDYDARVNLFYNIYLVVEFTGEEKMRAATIQ